MKYVSALSLAFLRFPVGTLPVEAERESKVLPQSFDTAGSLDEAFVLAKEKNKAVIVYYTRTRCPPCTILQSRLRREEVAAPFRDEYVFTALWSRLMDREKRAYYRDRYDVVGAPTWLVFDSGGGYVCTSIAGFKSDKAGKRLH